MNSESKIKSPVRLDYPARSFYQYIEGIINSGYRFPGYRKILPPSRVRFYTNATLNELEEILNMAGFSPAGEAFIQKSHQHRKFSHSLNHLFGLMKYHPLGSRKESLALQEGQLYWRRCDEKYYDSLGKILENPGVTLEVSTEFSYHNSTPSSFSYEKKFRNLAEATMMLMESLNLEKITAIFTLSYFGLSRIDTLGCNFEDLNNLGEMSEKSEFLRNPEKEKSKKKLF